MAGFVATFRGPCFARIEDVTPGVDAALLMTPPNVTDGVVRDCVNAGRYPR